MNHSPVLGSTGCASANDETTGYWIWTRRRRKMINLKCIWLPDAWFMFPGD